MYTKARQEGPLECEVSVGHRHTHKQIGVHVESEFRVKPADITHAFGFPERARLMKKEPSVQESLTHEWRVAMFLDNAVIRIDSIKVAVHDVQLRPSGKAAADAQQSARHIDVV